jgi:hypothetical protein
MPEEMATSQPVWITLKVGAHSAQKPTEFTSGAERDELDPVLIRDHLYLLTRLQLEPFPHRAGDYDLVLGRDSDLLHVSSYDEGRVVRYSDR